jgi:carbamoyltransferase
MTRCANLCLGGGVALNCSANGRLLAQREPGSVFIFPAAGDAGLSVGAALLSAAASGYSVCERLDHAQLGPAATDAEIQRAVANQGPYLTVTRGAAPDAVAQLLAHGSVIGWVQGRMEFGPRALGGRSILADPRSVAMRDRVNRLKQREHWRPLAPMVLEERAPDFFDSVHRSPFMLLAAPVRADRRPHVAGVVHVDGSARPQTVPREGSPALRAVLEAFAGRTGVPLLLNTSFNAAGEPIVCTPADAIASFHTMGLDALVMGDWLVERVSS